MQTTAPTPFTLRQSVQSTDPGAVRRIVQTTGFFSNAEVDVAVELVDETLHKGPDSGYEFIFAESNGEVVGYSCFGEIPCTQGSYDLYWIAVDPSSQGSGLGRSLLQATIDAVAKRRGRLIYIETSSKALYEPTRAFYRKCGCHREVVLDDYYAPGDGKVIYSVRISGE